MSIYEVMAAAAEYREASAFNGECVAKINLLRAAIEQHVAEEVARKREGCAKMADEYATWGGSNFYDWFKKLATAIRARGTT